MNRWRTVLGAALATMLAAGGARPQALEAAVEAAYLTKLGPFVDWPARPVSAPLVLCIAGRDPFDGLVDRAATGQSVAGRPIVVRRLPRAIRDSGCQIMYLGGAPGQSVKEALALLRGAPVLTVTDDAGGVIEFAIYQGRVRFRIDDQAAAENGLAISPRLLQLALSVREREGRR